jgi:hypothetical protein
MGYNQENRVNNLLISPYFVTMAVREAVLDHNRFVELAFKLYLLHG